jgi:arsenate reductase-like glutaredoxin family protein
LEAIAARLPGGATDLLSPRSTRYRELGLAGRHLPETELLDLLAAEPRLLRRPILVVGQRVVVGANRTALAGLRPDGG